MTPLWGCHEGLCPEMSQNEKIKGWTEALVISCLCNWSLRPLLVVSLSEHPQREWTCCVFDSWRAFHTIKLHLNEKYCGGIVQVSQSCLLSPVLQINMLVTFLIIPLFKRILFLWCNEWQRAPWRTFCSHFEFPCQETNTMHFEGAGRRDTLHPPGICL